MIDLLRKQKVKRCGMPEKNHADTLARHAK